jgi:hypothetical protein
MSETATKEQARQPLIQAKYAAQQASKYFKSLLPEVLDFSLKKLPGNILIINDPKKREFHPSSAPPPAGFALLKK